MLQPKIPKRTLTKTKRRREMRPRGSENEILGKQNQKTKNYHPNNDSFPETEEELKEFIKNLKEVKNGRIFGCQLVE